MYFRYFIIISPLKRAGPWFKQTQILFTQGCFLPNLVEIGPVVLERRFFYIYQCIFAISLLSPLGEWQGPSFEKTWIPFTQEWFMPSLIEIGPVVLEKMKMWKVYSDNDNKDDDENGQQTNFYRALGSGELKTIVHKLSI